MQMRMTAILTGIALLSTFQVAGTASASSPRSPLEGRLAYDPYTGWTATYDIDSSRLSQNIGERNLLVITVHFYLSNPDGGEPSVATHVSSTFDSSSALKFGEVGSSAPRSTLRRVQSIVVPTNDFGTVFIARTVFPVNANAAITAHATFALTRDGTTQAFVTKAHANVFMLPRVDSPSDWEVVSRRIYLQRLNQTAPWNNPVGVKPRKSIGTVMRTKELCQCQ
jgi:hypothetical protein